MDLSVYVPGAAQALNLPIALATMAGFAAVGGLVGGRDRDPTMDIFAGFGLVTGIMTILGVFLQLPFSWATYVFWAAAPIAALILWRRNQETGTSPAHLSLLVKIVLVGAPLLLAVSAMKASQWDEFSQWLPNTLFIVNFDAFPRNDLPNSPSVFPAYPHGGPFFGYLVSKAAGGFVENGVALGNTLLLFAFAAVYISMVRRGLGDDSIRLSGWFAAALGLLGVTFLSTVFVQKLVFTAYSDAPTGVLFAVLGILAWRILESLGRDDGEDRALAWQFALACMLFINLRQTNLVLLILLLGAVCLIVLRDPDIKLTKFLSRLPMMLIAPALVWFAWRYHVGLHLEGREFSLLPREQWLTDEAFSILARMLTIASNKGAYFGMMAVVSVIGIWSFFTGRGGSFGRLCTITGAIFVGYFLFLWAMYIAAFGPGEGRRAASFWRYNTQLGLLGASTAAMGIAIIWMRRIAPSLVDKEGLRKSLAGLLILAIFIVPIALNHKIRFDIRPQKDHMRMVGQDLAQTLPAGSKIALVDPKGQGFADIVVRFEITSFSVATPQPSFEYRYGTRFKSYDNMGTGLERDGVTHIWVHQTEPELNAWLGRELDPARSHLLVKQAGKWVTTKSWPYGTYTDPYSLPD